MIHARAQTNVVINPFPCSRSRIRALFALADDSPRQIESYIDDGEVFAARSAGRIVGHVQMIRAGDEWEIKSLAVIGAERRRGIGAALVDAALRHAFSSGARRVVLGTATADIDNLGFYQRRGFRMERVERDAFRAEDEYIDCMSNGIPLRDRVWFSMAADEHRKKPR